MRLHWSVELREGSQLDLVVWTHNPRYPGDGDRRILGSQSKFKAIPGDSVRPCLTVA